MSQLIRRLKHRSPEINNASRIASRDTGSQALREFLNHYTTLLSTYIISHCSYRSIETRDEKLNHCRYSKSWVGLRWNERDLAPRRQRDVRGRGSSMRKLMNAQMLLNALSFFAMPSRSDSFRLGCSKVTGAKRYLSWIYVTCRMTSTHRHDTEHSCSRHYCNIGVTWINDTFC